MKFSMRDKYKKSMNNPLYARWQHMKQRCNNPNNPDYKHYGARGIKVEDYLLIFENYVDELIRLLPKGETLSSMAKKKWSIDRYPNNDGNYERNNLRWASQTEQNLNRRIQKSNTSSYQGVDCHKRDKKWRVRIGYMYKRKQLGYFNTKQEAFIVYCKAYLEYFGQEDYNHMISLHPHWDDQLKQERTNHEVRL